MADLKKASDISIFKFYTGTLNDFVDYFNRQSQEEQQRLNEMIIFIHESDVTKKNGYIRANGKYYTSDISDFQAEIKQYIDNKYVALETLLNQKVAEGIAEAKDYADEKLDDVEDLIDAKIAAAKTIIETDYISRDASVRTELIDRVQTAKTECQTYTDNKFAELTPISVDYVNSL